MPVSVAPYVLNFSSTLGKSCFKFNFKSYFLIYYIWVLQVNEWFKMRQCKSGLTFPCVNINDSEELQDFIVDNEKYWSLTNR